MAPMPQSQRWPANRAVLLVHGVGNARPGDYAPLAAQLQSVLGDEAPQFAVYFVYYDQIDQWFSTKVQAGAQIGALVNCLRSKLDATRLGNVIADFAGDVIWPVLLADARHAVRTAVLLQLQQIVVDGQTAGHPPQEQHVSIIAHSLGCFHTYEALHAAAADPGLGLAPATWGVHLSNVVFMASPVQIIRTVARELGAAVQQPATLHTASQQYLDMPVEVVATTGQRVELARRTVSITGDLDPVGGHFFRARPAWAYMQLPGQESFVDPQQITDVNLSDEEALVTVLHDALRERQPPKIIPQNPHAWSAYVERHSDDLRRWLTA
jgi:hypothetical protein